MNLFATIFKTESATISNASTNTNANLALNSDTDVYFASQKIAEPITQIAPPPASANRKLPTPVKIERLANFLVGYDEATVAYLINGFTEGFSLECKGMVNTKEPKNLKSAYLNPTVVDAKLAKELALGRIIGPFDAPPFENMCISPIGLQVKKSGDFRLITHLSHPKGSSVNDAIPRDFASVKYATLGEAITLVKRSGRFSYLAKTDIKSAFRIIPIRPADHRLLGIKWRGKYFVDVMLPMGASSSCRVFETFSTAVEWIARNKLGIPSILHILDDYLIVNNSKSNCFKQLQIFKQFCEYCGIPLAEDKTVGPEQVMPFAGIELDSIRMRACLPQDKLDKCNAAIRTALGKIRINLKEIQELAGLLNFCCVVVYPGRPFIRRLYNLSIGLRSRYSTIAMSEETKADLKMWLSFLANFNGKDFFMTDEWVAAEALNLHSDAAMTKGFGATLGKEWIMGAWPDSLGGVDITTLEFYPIIISLITWGPKLRNLNLNINTDNEALVSIINAQTVKGNEVCLKLLRLFVLTCLKYNIYVRAFHIRGVDNSICDALSRLQVGRFRSLAPGMNLLPIPIPHHLSPEILLRT